MLATLNEQKERKMALKVYVDRMSQPSRAILLLCKVNGIEFEEVKIQLAKSEHRSSEFAEINPMKQVPAIVHGDFKLFERLEVVRVWLGNSCNTHLPGFCISWSCRSLGGLAAGACIKTTKNVIMEWISWASLAAAS